MSLSPGKSHPGENFAIQGVERLEVQWVLRHRSSDQSGIGATGYVGSSDQRAYLTTSEDESRFCDYGTRKVLHISSVILNTMLGRGTQPFQIMKNGEPSHPKWSSLWD